MSRKQPSNLLSDLKVERVEKYARMLHRSIRLNLDEVDFFTREDLLQLPVFMHITTITRYHYICLATQVLLTKGDIVSKTRTGLCLPRHARSISDTPLAEQYAVTIQKLVERSSPKKAFGVMDIVDAWTTDPHLTINNKRVAVRGSMNRLIKQGIVKLVNEFEYKVVSPSQ